MWLIPLKCVFFSNFIHKHCDYRVPYKYHFSEGSSVQPFLNPLANLPLKMAENVLILRRLARLLPRNGQKKSKWNYYYCLTRKSYEFLNRQCNLFVFFIWSIVGLFVSTYLEYINLSLHTNSHNFWILKGVV